jgi:protein-disulfide isomerase
MASLFTLKGKKTAYLLTALLLPATYAAPGGAQGIDAAPADQAAAPRLPTRKQLLEISDKDIVLGDKNAPVTVIEYASLSCSHCASFHHTTFPELKANYADTGKIRFVLRDFPLNKPAVVASQVARCAPKEKFYDYVSALFAAQTQWLGKEAEKQLLGIARLGGMTKEEFDACLANKELEKSVMESRYHAAQVLQVRSTPTFFVEGIQYEGGKSYQFFSSAIDKLLAERGVAVPPAATEPAVKEGEGAPDAAPVPAPEANDTETKAPDAATETPAEAAPAEKSPEGGAAPTEAAPPASE